MCKVCIRERANAKHAGELFYSRRYFEICFFFFFFFFFFVVVMLKLCVLTNKVHRIYIHQGKKIHFENTFISITFMLLYF